MADSLLKPILDPCSGSRMFYFDKEDPRVLFGDIRHLDTTLTDGNAPGGVRELHIHPDMEMDFRALPFGDGTFPLVIFDPPHLRKAGETSWLAQKYGRLPDFGWKEYLAEGLAECWRVLKSEGTLIFKWNEQQIKFGTLQDIFPAKPVVRFSPKEKTVFVVFFKENQQTENQ